MCCLTVSSFFLQCRCIYCVLQKPIKETQTSVLESSLRPFCASIVLNWWPGQGGCCERWADKSLKLTRKGNRFEQKAIMGTLLVLISRAVEFSESRLILHFLLVNVTCSACRKGASSPAGFLHVYTQSSKWIHKHSFTRISSNAVERTPPCLRELSAYIELKITNAAWKRRNKNTI